MARTSWYLVRPQFVAVGSDSWDAAVLGVRRWSHGALGGLPTAVNLLWITYDVAVLGIVVRALRHQGYEGVER